MGTKNSAYPLLRDALITVTHTTSRRLTHSSCHLCVVSLALSICLSLHLCLSVCLAFLQSSALCRCAAASMAGWRGYTGQVFVVWTS